ncbi:MAG: DUF302 domain-containing protein [Campylobacterota bacterium]|nr:DUF302 domain-containing protein [Campylobacterota bacterium]
MKILFLIIAIVNSLLANDIIVKQSSCSVDVTVENIKNILRANDMSVFAIINHRGNAKMVNMKLNKSKMIVFGKAELGTVLMQQDMRVGLDLPLRILVYLDTDNKVKMAYRDGSWLENKHILNAPKKVKKINEGMQTITNKAGQCKQD